MTEYTQAVLAGDKLWHVEQGDCLEFVNSLPDKSVELILGSPPYEDSRWYGEVNFKLSGEAWVAWVLEFIGAATRVCKGLLALVVGHGRTRDWRWSAAPHLLLADLHRAGFHLRNAPVFYRVGISGSGQRDWLRADYETVICVQCSGPGPLPWSNNTALGRRPKWAPGGEQNYRNQDGSRRNQWGGSEEGMGTRRPNGSIQTKKRPSHKTGTPRQTNGEREVQGYVPPVLANPGGVFQEHYSAQEVAELLAWYESGDVCHAKVGGGHMGHPLAHVNEAPYPLDLASFFVLSFCRPGGVVLDCFNGSGTTGHAAVQFGRRYLGVDVRQDQIDLTTRRLQSVTPFLEVPSDLRKAERDARQAARHQAES